MKKIYHILGLFIFLLPDPTKAMAQTITEEQLRNYAQQLVSVKILTGDGANLMIKQVLGREVEIAYQSTVKSVSYTSTDVSKETILRFCEDAFASSQMIRGQNFKRTEGRIKPEDGTPTAWTISLTTFLGNKNLGKDYIDPSRSTMGLTPRRTLNDFLNIGLIDQIVFDKCLDAIKTKSIEFEKDLIHLMIDESLYHRFHDFHKQEQTEYISKLVQTGLIIETAQQQLLDSYKDSLLKTIPEILQYSHRYVRVDLSAQDSSPATTYRIIFDSVKKLIPDFNYQDLQTSITEKDTSSGLIRMDVTLSFKANDMEYQHQCFYNYRRLEKTVRDIEPMPIRIGEDFQKIINQWLRDQESPFRLYTISLYQHPAGRGMTSQDQVGLLLLKDGEAGAVSTDVSLISRENYDTLLSPRNMEGFITRLMDNSFFHHLTPNEISEAKQQIRRSSPASLGEVLLAFPKTIVQFDWETGNLKDPYAMLTHQFTEATHGAVSVTSVKDEFKSGWDKKAKKIRYGFTMNGKSYEAILPFNGDWLAPEFMDLLQQALQENAGGQFYQCTFNGQEAGYIFLTQSQLAFVMQEFPALLEEN